jgi:hypothetical protein
MVNGADSFGSSSDPNEHEDKPYMYLDYGSADGCSTGCSNKWKPAQVAYVSWGATVAQGLPEIYVSGQVPD